ncbi:MAG: hypothetical protein R2769_02790 [Saprospiraceae bacterium]
MKINGEKQPEAVFKKYKSLYQEMSGKAITKDSKWEVEKSFKEEY